MTNNLSKAYQDSLEVIYTYISESEFLKAERELLNIIKKVIDTKSYRSSEVIPFINLIYTDFNSNYFKWLTQSGARIRVQLADLYTKEHNNYLIGNCSDPAAMDDLLYEILHYDVNTSSDVDHHYTCYVTRMKKQTEKTSTTSLIHQSSILLFFLSSMMRFRR